MRYSATTRLHGGGVGSDELEEEGTEACDAAVGVVLVQQERLRVISKEAQGPYNAWVA